MTVGQLLVRIGIDRSQYVNGINQTRHEGEGLASFLKGAFKFSIGMGMFDLLQKGMEAAKDTAINFNSEMEQSQIAFTTMLGSAQKAKTFLAGLQKMAANTPYEFIDLTSASKKLLAYGFSMEQIPKMLTAIGDASSGLGMSGNEGLTSIGVALGQINGAGKISADNMRQLTEVGIPAWKILADATGKTTAEVMKLSQQGLLPAKESIDVLITGMEQRFPNMMTKQSKSFNGLMSTLKDNTQIVISKVAYNGLKKLEGGISSLVNKTQTFANVFSKSGLKEALKTILPDSVVNKLYSFGNWMGSSVISLVKQVGSEGLKLVGVIFDVSSSMDGGTSIIQNFVENGLITLRDILAWFVSNKAAVKVALVGLITAFLTSIGVSAVASIYSFISGVQGLTTAFGLLKTELMTNPLTAIITAITVAVGTGVMAFANYRAEIEKTQEAAKNLQDFADKGIKNDNDNKKTKKTLSTAEQKINENEEIKKQLEKLNPKSNTKLYEELTKIINEPNSETNSKRIKEIAKKLGIKIPKGAEKQPSSVLARNVQSSLRFKGEKNSDKISKLQNQLSDNNDWLKDNGYLGKTTKEIQAENKQLAFVTDSFSKLQGWQKKYSNNGKFISNEKKEMANMLNGILSLNKERSNIIKNAPSILSDKDIQHYIDIKNKGIRKLTKGEQGLVNQYYDALKPYNEKLKTNTAKYKNYGVTFDTANMALGIINPILNPSKNKINTDGISKKLAEEQKKLGDELNAKISAGSGTKKDPVAALKAAVEAQLINKNAQLDQLLVTTGNTKTDIANLTKAKGVLASEKGIYQAGLAKLKKTIGVTQDDINSYNKALSDIDTKTKSIKTDITKLMTQDKVEGIKKKFTYYFINMSNKVDALLGGADSKDGNDLSRLQQALKDQKQITKKYGDECNEYVKTEGKNSDDAIQAYQNKNDSLKNEAEIQKKITELQKGSSGIGTELLQKLNKKLMDSIAPISAEADEALKQHQQKLKAQINQSTGIVDKLNLDFSGNKLFNSTFWSNMVTYISKAIQATTSSTELSKRDVIFNVNTTDTSVVQDISKEMKIMQYMGLGGILG